MGPLYAVVDMHRLAVGHGRPNPQPVGLMSAVDLAKKDGGPGGVDFGLEDDLLLFEPGSPAVDRLLDVAGDVTDEPSL